MGGGPAGMMAAGTAAKNNKKVILYEKNKKLGRKLLITGKGRCNITSAKGIQEMIDNIPINGSFLYSAFYTFSNDHLIDLLNNLGLETKVERGDRVFPVSDKARDVLKILEKYLYKNGAKIENKEIIDIEKENDQFILTTNKNEKITAKKVVIATGGKSYPKTGSTGAGYEFAKKLGHTINSLYPSLVPLVTEEDWVKDLQGLSLKNVDLIVFNKNNKVIFKERGEMIFTHYGISGPLVLSASSHMRNMKNENYKIKIDIKPALDREKLDNRIQRDFSKYANKYFKNSLGDLLPSKLIPVIVKLSKIDYDKTVNQITTKERENLINLLKGLELNIQDYRPIEEAIVTSGGVEVKEIDPATMESKIVKNLYFAGEVIDVDAYTGGFNLQIAFSTGYLVGINI
ncbi:MAG TPA: NAD(P)/FAD-dependent oxidoreductase [Halanaerobiales bacterium]|nr:NAD(P)/FAD-dependent oxidoreductase [Halanaerobiales bacterium]